MVFSSLVAFHLTAMTIQVRNADETIVTFCGIHFDLKKITLINLDKKVSYCFMCIVRGGGGG